MQHTEFSKAIHKQLKVSGYKYILWRGIDPEMVGFNPACEFGQFELVPHREMPQPRNRNEFVNSIDDKQIVEAAGKIDNVFCWVNNSYL